ncbi:O-antigen ligase family protein [Verrucomicrobiaceae bacterium N1E253]|uniref:O-antigen ligase family protein n=1 Tax=Oceaniferula marina TaxID=2748318 RepID=A0A851GM29_9BACT|nr:O-antigen ligase family protein [Oceaniferula marina]NWK55184.1 O-antigen ligase family protein [Oceaniferula marina]
MQSIIIILACLGMLLAGSLGITLSVPLQAPAVILLGLAAILAAIQVLKPGSAGVWESKVKRQKVQNPSTLDSGRKSWLLGLSLGSIFYFVGRAWFSPVFDLGVEDLMLILPASILYLVAGYGMRGKSGVHLRMGLAITVIVLLLLHIGSCVLQIKGGEGYSLTPLFTGAVRSSDGHVTGMYGYYGSFANFAVIAGLLSLSLGIWGRGGFASRGALFLFGALALSLAAYSQSRSAVISLIPSLFVFIILLMVSVAGQTPKVRTRARIGMWAFGGVIASVCIIGVTWVFSERALPQDQDQDLLELFFAGGVRVPYWTMAVEQWADYPVFGAGSRSFSYLSFEYWSSNLPTGEANPEFVHNEYLQLLADYGFVGLILVIALLVWHCFSGCKQVRLLAGKIPSDGLVRGFNAIALTVAGVSGMTAMAMHVCFDFRTHLLANLLLLVCCAIWTLPLVRSRVRKCGSAEVLKLNGAEGTQHVKGQKSSCGRDGRAWGLGVVLLCLGGGAVGLGGQQLWTGMPLLKNQMAKEDGAWVPQDVDRDVWIPALQESLERAPQWRRYQRLATLYRLEARDAADEDEKLQNLLSAEQAYLDSISRHPYNPVSRINLAAIYTEQKQWQEADAMYASASDMAKARERWFRMHSQWGDMHVRWAVDLWEKEEVQQAEAQFLRAKERYLSSYEYGYFFQNKQYVVEYTSALLVFARFLDAQERFDDAELLFQEGKKQVNWYNWQTDTGLLMHYAQHLYLRGRYLWGQRKPEEAYQLMVRAASCLKQYRGVMKGNVDQQWHNQLAEIQEVITFLQKAGIANEVK